MSQYPRNIGKIGEEKACLYLKSQGFFILKKNFRSYGGEVDIIAKKKDSIYFIEVKTRTNLKKGFPYEAVNKWKILRLKKAANYYLLKFPHKAYKLKLGVISLLIKDHGEELKFYDDLS